MICFDEGKRIKIKTEVYKASIPLPKWMLFRKSSKNGEGNFWSKNQYCKISFLFSIFYTRNVNRPPKICNIFLWNWGGRRGDLFQKIIRFGKGMNASLMEESVRLNLVCRSFGGYNIQVICAHTVLLFMVLAVTIIPFLCLNWIRKNIT